jgi:hypothetical protein
MSSPVCKKLVFTSTFFRERHSNILEEDEQQDEDRELMKNSGSSDSSDSEPDSIRQSSQDIKPEKANSSTRTSFLTSEDDISIFKRVLQEIPNNSISNIAANFAHQISSSISAFAKSQELSIEAMQKRLADMKGKIEHAKLASAAVYAELIVTNEKLGNFNMQIGPMSPRDWRRTRSRAGDPAERTRSNQERTGGPLVQNSGPKSQK